MLRDHNGDGEFSENEVFVFAKDHLNSVREITDHNQKLIQRYNYGAYGKTKLERIAGGADIRFVENYFTHASREWEPEIGIICNIKRCHDMNGRWLSEDRKSFNGGMNLYNYIENNPIIDTDPNGESPLLLILIGAMILIPEQIGPEPKTKTEDYHDNLPAELRFQREKTKKKIRKFEKDNNLLEGSCELG